MASVWGELKRRNVVKVAVAYAVVGWLLIEVASTVLPTFEAPQWVLQTITFVIILGFPLALVLSWIFDFTPTGVERTDSQPRFEGAANVSGRKLDFAIIGALVLGLGFVVVDNYVLEDNSGEPSEVATNVLPNSVAVLPFENLSPDPDNAYFAAGIHDTILNELAKLRNMNVIARTSVLPYADGQTPIPDIARELNVGTVMEGTVQYAEGRILVTAQLIDPETSAHLWSDNYDREFADIFAIQSDIAMNIANALEAEFSLEEQESIERIPTQSPAAYALYLQGLSAATAESFYSFINQAVAVDPQFALAYAQRAVLNTYDLVGAGFGLAPDEALELERSIYEDAERARSIDPTLVIPP